MSKVSPLSESEAECDGELYDFIVDAGVCPKSLVPSRCEIFRTPHSFNPRIKQRLDAEIRKAKPEFSAILVEFEEQATVVYRNTTPFRYWFHLTWRLFSSPQMRFKLLGPGQTFSEALSSALNRLIAEKEVFFDKLGMAVKIAIGEELLIRGLAAYVRTDPSAPKNTIEKAAGKAFT